MKLSPGWDCRGADALGNALGQGLIDAMGDPGYSRDEMLGDYQREQSRFVALAKENLTAADAITSDSPEISDVGPLGAIALVGRDAENANAVATPTSDFDSNGPVQRVVITGHKLSELERQLYDAENFVDDRLRANIADFYEAQKDVAARNQDALGYLGAHYMGLLGQTGVNLAHSAVGLTKLATDPRAQIDAVVALGGALAHPLDTVASLYQNARAFLNKPFGEQADTAFEFAATAGVIKLAAVAGEASLTGAVRAANASEGSFGLRLGDTGGANGGVLTGEIDGAAVGPNGASLPLGGKRLQFNQPESPWYQPIRNDPTTIGETSYSGHAIDRMQDRGVMPSVVQSAIDSGVATPSRMGTTVYYDSANNVSVVTNAQGKVVTVKYGR